MTALFITDTLLKQTPPDYSGGVFLFLKRLLYQKKARTTIQKISVDSQVAEHISLILSWGEIVQTLLRLKEGENYTLLAGHATSIRTLEGWQRAYAFENTVVQGPLDIETPIPMTPKEFAPMGPEQSTISPNIFTALMIGGAIFILALSHALGGKDMGYQFGIMFGSIIFFSALMVTFLNLMRGHDLKSDKHGCATPSERIFWKENLVEAQTQRIFSPIKSA